MKYTVATDFEFPGINGPTDIGKSWSFECSSESWAVVKARGWLTSIGATVGALAQHLQDGKVKIVKVYHNIKKEKRGDERCYGCAYNNYNVCMHDED
jgi:hypothetical protein